MWRVFLAAAVSLWLIALPALAQDEVTGTVKEERLKEPDAPNRAGLEMVKRSLLLGNMTVRYQQVVDPRQGNKPVVQQYGDYILGCEFPRYTWNWDLEYFIEVTVSRPGAEPFAANRVSLQKGLYLLQQGQRGVADMVWDLPPLPGQAAGKSGEMVIRLVKTAADPQWLSVRVTVEGDPTARITRVRLESYPTTTTGPPERQRWVMGLARGLQMGNAPQALNPAEDWALALHNRFAQEEGGALIVADPAEITAMSASGTYAVAVVYDTVPSAAVHLALGYFWDTPWEKAVDSFRQEAPERLKALQAADWSVPLDVASWEREQADVEELLALDAKSRADFGAQWLGVSTQAETALKQAGEGDPGAARRFALLIRQARALKAELYEPALKGLIEQATQ